MEDTCSSPGINKTLQSFRIYSVLIPTTLIILVLEGIFVLSKIQGNIGSGKTIIGSLPTIPAGLLNSKKLETHYRRWIPQSQIHGQQWL